MQDYITTCEAAARAGGRELISWMGRFQAREKGPSDLVSEADLASQETIRRVILERFPDHGFVAEENDTHLIGADDRFRWIVDPLDGTVNYVHGVPQFAVSIALEREGRLIAGVVLDPISDECFTAVAGEGAFLNGQPLRVSDVTAMDQSLMVASFPPRVQRNAPEVHAFVDVLVACQTLRRTGSAAINLAFLAAGRFDGYWATSTKVWDIAAGVLLVREAGGVVTGIDGGPIDLNSGKVVAAASPQLHAQLLPLVSGETGGA